MIIRAALKSDLLSILEIYNDAVLHTTASYDIEPVAFGDRAVWFEDHLRRDLPVLVAEAPEGKVVGWGALSPFHNKPGYFYTLEDSVYIAEGWRGQGIGRQLLARLIELAREREFHVIMALIDGDGVASIRLHEAFGFEQVGYFKEVGKKFGRWLDVVYMELVL